MVSSERIKFTLESMGPILFDRYSGIQDANDAEAQKNADEKCYRNDKGELCIPAAGIKACIRNAGREIGKKMECKRREQSIRAGLYFTEQMYSIGKKEPDKIHAELVTRKGTGNKVTRVVTYRPCVDKWKIECEAALFDLTPDFIRQAVELGGFRFGLFGHRPEFGRFKLVKFEVLK